MLLYVYSVFFCKVDVAKLDKIIEISMFFEHTICLLIDFINEAIDFIHQKRWFIMNKSLIFAL